MGQKCPYFLTFNIFTMFKQKQFIADMIKARETKGVTIRGLSASSKVPHPTIHRIEAGQVPMADTFAAICKALGLDAKKYF